MHTVGEERGGKRVSGIAFVAVAIELEWQWLRPVDDAARREPKGLRHDVAPGNASSMRALARMSCVRVSRRTLNHCRHPALCSHSSWCGPRGLSRREEKSKHDSHDPSGEARVTEPSPPT